MVDRSVWHVSGNKPPVRYYIDKQDPDCFLFFLVYGHENVTFVCQQIINILQKKMTVYGNKFESSSSFEFYFRILFSNLKFSTKTKYDTLSMIQKTAFY